MRVKAGNHTGTCHRCHLYEICTVDRFIEQELVSGSSLGQSGQKHQLLIDRGAQILSHCNLL